MADNIDIKDAANATVTLPTKDIGGIEYPVGMTAKSDGTLIDPATTADAQAIRDRLPAALVGGKLSVTDPTALPLPSGASTAANQTATNAKLDTLIGQTDGVEASLTSIDGKLPALSGGKVPVTDPSALPLPAGAATAANQTATNTGIGAPADAAAPTGNGSLVALTKAMRDFLATLESADYAPGYGPADQGGSRPSTDPSGNLVARAQVLSDEGTFRVNFANSSLAVSLGTVTMTNGSAAVTWSIASTTDVHAGDYIKLDADAESAWAQIESVDSLTGGTLVAAYTGTGGTSAGSRAIVRPFTGTGGGISVASGQCTITSGTTNSAATGIDRLVDYAPIVFRARASISQRIANQETHIGLEERTEPARWFARFNADGTTNTTIKCQTGRNPTGAPSASETQETTITLPNGATTATLQEYRVELLTEVVRFYIEGVLVASHSRVIPAQHDDMRAHIEVRNGTGAASSTSVVVDFLTGKNHNKVEVGILSDAEQIVAAAAPATLFAYNVAGVIPINTDLIVIDCAQFRSLSIHSVSMGTTGVVTAAWSNDPGFTNPITATLYDQTGGTNTTFNAGSLLRMTNVLARYFRLRLTTATTAGTTTINVQAFQQQLAPPVATQPVSGTVTATVTSTRVTPNAGDGHSTTHHLISAATTNATSVKTSAGAIGLILVSNNNAAARYFKLYNKASAPTVGTDTPILTVFIPPNSTVPIEGNSPIRCSTGIAYALTTGIAVVDTGAVGANEMSVGILYT